MVKKTKITPRKEPTQERSRSTVETILTAAAQILEGIGFDSATTNRIAERAGISIGSLYQYFPNKESLANALVEKFVRNHAEKVEKLLVSMAKKPADEMISEIITEVVSMYFSNLKMLRILAALIPKINMIPSVLETRRRIVQSISKELQARASEIDCKDIDFAAFLIVNSIMGVIQVILYDSSREVDQMELSKELTKMARRYLIS